jgi:hypothetical protein
MVAHQGGRSQVVQLPDRVENRKVLARLYPPEACKQSLLAIFDRRPESKE